MADVDSIWRSLKNEDNASFKNVDLYAKFARKKSKAKQKSKKKCFVSNDSDKIKLLDIDSLVIKEDISMTNNANDHDAVNAVGAISILGNEPFGNVGNLHLASTDSILIDSDDKDDAGDVTIKQRTVTSNRIQRLASALNSDDAISRADALGQLKEIIDALAKHCAGPPHLMFAPPYSDDEVKLKQNLPLVSDLAHSNPKHATGDGPARCFSADTPHKEANTGLDVTHRCQLQAVLDMCGGSLFRGMSDKSEKCRALSVSCIQSLLLAGLDMGRHVAYFIPAIVARHSPNTYDKEMEVFVQNEQMHDFYKRGGATDRQDREGLLSASGSFQVIEPNEELRLLLCITFRCLVRGALANGSGMLDAYFGDIILSLQSSLKDPFPEVKIESSLLLVQLLRVPRWGQGAKYFATGLARATLSNCRHRNAKVVVASIELLEASICVPDRDKVKGAGTAAIADLIGYKQDNILPVAAFYASECAVSVNMLAELASHKSVRVRLHCCKMLSYFLVYLPDRYDHQQRLLPYVLSFVNDTNSNIRKVALDCIEKCGGQYECEHPDEIIERRQLGVDGEESIDYDNDLPRPFTSRPTIGARLYVRSNTSRFFLAVLSELSSWKEETRRRSVDLLMILVVYVEEHLTREFQHTINSIAKAVAMEEEEGVKDGILERIGQVLQLMGKYIDPSTYLPLITPRISGDTSSGASSAEDGSHSEKARSCHAFILAWLVKGTPIHRVLPHWLATASILTGSNCMGPYVGSKVRRESLNALSSLLGKATDTKNLGSYISYLKDMGEFRKVRSTLLNIMDVMNTTDAQTDAPLARNCSSGFELLVSAIDDLA